MYSIDYLNALRRAELRAVLDLFPRGGRVLEIGAGSGQQAGDLKAAGFDVAAIDLAGSYLAAHRVFPVIDYDGQTIPFPDRSFDVVFSSNVLEHIADLDVLQREVARVLKPDGVCVHIVPSHIWRLWTSLAAVAGLPKYIWTALTAPSRQNAFNVARQAGVILLQPRHGEHGHALTELWTFHPAHWRKRFAGQGFVVAQERPGGFFYTGEGILAERLDLARRQQLARTLGSACYVFQLRLA